MTGKRALRVRMRAARDASPRAGAIDPAPLLPLLRAGTTVASYAPLGSEADPAPLAAAARAAGCRIALPRVASREEPMRFLLWDGPLEPGPLGLRQPPGHAPEAAPELVLVPLLAFDRRGNRLGQGAGHYDRALATLPGAYRLGVAWSAQEVDALEPDPWDVLLHAVVTEKEWIVP